ncbi:ubiquitin carboxyl-terminal hydrolase 7 isoform X1 [Drosophila subpulchrella]|uniref:ubiquitin carboxyl-terminal hydrolase 7 isoform X1 n=1 Tax=Drosophila subpulchrella TaxID=1486046 RepID=UPI0018A1826C|nr:ubiquitin carboxyl-terminal hydrolase 7 isoform X1 [Drosophila subpulchrella]
MEIETDQSIEAMDTQDTQEVEILTSDLQQQPQQQQTPQQQQNSPPQLPKFKNLIQPQLHAVGAVTQLPSENGNVPPQQLLADSSSASFGQDAEAMGIDDDSKEDQFRSETTFSFTVENVGQLKSQRLSPPVYVRMLPWKIMVIPNDRALGFFLQCNGENDSPTWSCNAIAELRLKCHKPDAQPFTRARIKHLFYSKENDYGYSNFITWQELQDADKNYVHNNSITLEVHVIADAPHGVLWDSKKHTGYVGLKNQGATCYMNSLLQTLYFTNSLRLSVYRIPTEADDSTKSVGLSLQRVFHELQFGDRPVGTKKLTKSFGWETLDSFMQHDVQEFLRVLLDKLESKMKGTTLEGTIPGLFEGKMSSYIKCKNVDYNSTRYETFYDIQLNIKDKKNIYESFQDYVASETLEGDNKYDAGVHGLQEASKGVIFTAFPPVLHLHLMRFQYDPITDSSIKYNDRFEFYEQINLDRYLAESEKTSADYVLHAVLVHSGDNHGGHYVVFINPKADGRWFKFDDDVVSSCRKQEAIEQNYGGMDDEISFHAKCSNAYMLVYIRQSELERVLGDIPENEISSDLVERLDLEKRIEMARRKERSEANLYVSVHVILEEYFEDQHKRRLFDLEKAHPRIFRIKQNQTVDELVDMFVKGFGVSRDRMRIWNMCTAQTQKFLHFDFEAEASRTIEQIPTSQKPWVIWLELACPNVPGPLPPFNPKSEVLLFLKYYDARNKRLNYIGCTQQPYTRRLIDLVPEVNRKLGFDPETELTIYDEYADKKLLNLNEPIESVLFIPQDHLQGHILIFERECVDAKLDLPTVEDYFLDLVYRIEIIFSDKCNPNEPDFTLELSNRYNYEQLTNAVAERLNTDPQKLQFFMCINNYKETAGNAVPYTFKVGAKNGTIKDLVSYTKQSTPKRIFYQRLSLSIHELDNKKQFKCVWVSSDLKDEKELVLYPNKNDTVKGLLEEAAKKITFAENSRRKLRLMKVSNHKIVAVCKDDIPLDTLLKTSESITSTQGAQKTYRIEEVPAEEMQLAENEFLIPVAHFSKELYNSFGVPFLTKARQGEPYGALKQRIQRRLNVPDKEWENYKFSVITMGHNSDVNDNTPVDLEVYRSWTTGQLPFFGLDHINKSRKRSSLNFSEKAIKIYN